jgi:hypothetical protein
MCPPPFELGQSWTGEKAALTYFVPSMVSVQLCLVPAQAIGLSKSCCHPSNDEPGLGTAVRVTAVPSG